MRAQIVHRRTNLLVLLASAAALLVMWSLIVPIFETPDEPHHWAYARYVHDHWSLPPYTRAFLEANQPPLYYYLIAPVAKRADLPPARASLVNGTFRVQSPPRLYLDDLPSDLRKYWPLRWARLITVLLSLVTVFFTYLAGCEAAGKQAGGFLSAGLVALLPQFTFRGTSISNDAMVTTMSAVATYFIIRLIWRGFSWKTGCAASVCIALAFLSKISAIIFIPLLVLVLITGRGEWRIKAKRFAVLLPGAICVAPWVIHNVMLYGDPLATKPILRMVPFLIDKKSIWSSYFATTFPTKVTESFIGVFGWMNVYLPEFIYWIFGLLMILGIAGFVRRLVAGKINARLAMTLIVLPVLAIASVVNLNLTLSQPQGRYLFTALPAFMVLVAIGLGSLPRWRPRWTYATLILLAGINLYALFGVEFPTYWGASAAPTAHTARLPVRAAG